MSVIYSLVGFLIAIGVLVAVHEFGHFWVARKLGVKVLRFSIGFGKPLYQKIFGEDKTEFVVAAIPLGGYVKMLGEGDDSTAIAPQDQARTFDSQPIWKRSLIVAAGPGINFLFAAILFVFLGLPERQELVPVFGEVPEQSAAAKAGIVEGDRLVSVDGKAVEGFGQHDLYIFNKVLKGESIALEVQRGQSASRITELDVSNVPIYNINPGLVTRTLGLVPIQPEITTEVARLIDDGPAAGAGLLEGDKVIAVDGRAMSGWADLVQTISTAPGQALEFSIERDGVLQQITITPEAAGEDEQAVGRIGIGPRIMPWEPNQLVSINRHIGQALVYGIEQTWLMSVVTVRMLWKMVTLQVSHKNISGPITIADYAGQAIQVSLASYISILAVISISLGVMNLLPIPMLDGGHLLMYAVEIVGGKNLSEKVFAVGQRFGVLLLICLMSLAFYNDIFRLLN